MSATTTTKSQLYQAAFNSLGVTALPLSTTPLAEIARQRLDEAFDKCIEAGPWVFARREEVLHGAGYFWLPGDCVSLLDVGGYEVGWRVANGQLIMPGVEEILVQYVSNAFWVDVDDDEEEIAMPAYFRDAVIAQHAGLLAPPILNDVQLSMTYRQVAEATLSDALLLDVQNGGRFAWPDNYLSDFER